MQAFGDFFLRKGAIYRVLKVPERQSGACSRIGAQGPLRRDFSLFSQKNPRPCPYIPQNAKVFSVGPYYIFIIGRTEVPPSPIINSLLSKFSLVENNRSSEAR